MFNHNEFAREHHKRIIDKGYWKDPKELGTLLMLVVTEITKLFDKDRLNKSEKLADIALRLYDLCGYYKIDLTELPHVKSCTLYDMLSMLTNELEATRVSMPTNWIYLKRCLSMTWFYASLNRIDLEKELNRKSEILVHMETKKF